MQSLLLVQKKMGHTYAGATILFGAVQLSPETDNISYELNGEYKGDVYKYCAGYKYEDQTIVGFSHTHLSGDITAGRKLTFYMRAQPKK